MDRTTMRMLLLTALASAGVLASACASGPAEAGGDPAPSTAPSAETAAADGADAAPAPRATHPRIGATRSCVECHERRTPDVVESWRESEHGQTNVGCFICHGDTQEEFMVRPEPALCMSCHAGQLEDFEVVEGHTFRFIDR